MSRDVDRVGSLRDALRQAGLDALVCALPANVLLLSGYWPVVGTSVAVATRDGGIALLVPEDEQDLAAHGWADEVHTFQPASLDDLRDAAGAVHEPLATAARSLGLTGRRVGYEAGPAFEPASYAALHLYGAGMLEILHRALGTATLVPADDRLATLRSRKTPTEVARIATACGIAGRAFEKGASALRIGLREPEAASRFRAPLGEGVGVENVRRADGFAWCMSGPNAALASRAYARTRDRQLTAGDLVLVHCNSYADGYWTDITRTFCLGDPDDRQRALYDAVFAARSAALAALRPGVKAADVDAAARAVLRGRGFGKAFRHSTGHGVGFAAIDHNALPRLHPASADTLEPGMVFNVEPAVYFDAYGGLRHCDVVTVTADGFTVLTPFQADPAALLI